MSGKEADAVLKALPAITEYASFHGSTPTALMQDLLLEIGGLETTPEGPSERQARKKKPLEDLPLNHQRALWINHEEVTAERTMKEQARIQEAEERRMAAEERIRAREEKLRQKEENKKQRELLRLQREEAKRKREEEKRNNPRRRATKTMCANAGCEIEYREGGPDADEWLGCDYCSKWFCAKRACMSLLAKHEKICSK